MTNPLRNVIVNMERKTGIKCRKGNIDEHSNDTGLS